MHFAVHKQIDQPVYTINPIEVQMASRREFLKQSIAGLALTTLPSGAIAEQVIRYYQLTAKPNPHFFDKNPLATNLWLYNNASPGPMIKAKKGDVLDVDFFNNLDQPTTIHWHGIRNINSMDGIPDLTQAAVQPGERFHYRFPLNDAGTFWYHSHNKAWEQVARGLYGPLVVYDHDLNENDDDILILADDWLINSNEQIDESSFGNFGHWSHGGRLGNALSINGKFKPTIPISSHSLVRLRFLNAANARVLTFELSGQLTMNVICLDGSPCKPFSTNRITLGPAQRIDVIIEDASKLTNLFEVSSSKALHAASFKPISSKLSSIEISVPPLPYYAKPISNDAKIINIHMQGGAMGNLSKATFQGEKRNLRDLALNEAKIWAFNGNIGGYELSLAEIKVDEVIVIKVWNDTGWPHSMHLHGHHFWVDSSEFGVKRKSSLRDTYLMQPGEKADLLFIANNPGAWLFHCHMLEHHAAGMGGVIYVS